ncbi:hypothetical protein L596_030057 [Steinernema carpocapsae]|uniref:Helitron helicase-like domain-containing protein n=1 Tax=Steinernema carpocapsae TaxID=34508 RepID=A0A4U5LRM1_STECR|nr:hypothetical protein L596_030057 [Steinernema carpocapsae]
MEIAAGCTDHARRECSSSPLRLQSSSGRTVRQRFRADPSSARPDCPADRRSPNRRRNSGGDALDFIAFRLGMPDKARALPRGSSRGINKRQSQHRMANGDKLNSQRREYYEANREELNSQRRESARRHRILTGNLRTGRCADRTHPGFGCASRDHARPTTWRRISMWATSPIDAPTARLSCWNRKPTQVFCKRFQPGNYVVCCRNWVMLRQGKSRPREDFDKLQDLPLMWQTLLEGSHPQSATFLEYEKALNSNFAFGSVSTTSAEPSKAPGIVKLNGELNYHMSDLLPPTDNEMPAFAQVYALDSHKALERRAKNIQDAHKLNNRNLENIKTLATAIDRELKVQHPFVELYKTARDLYAERLLEAEEAGQPVRDVLIRLLDNREARRGRSRRPPASHRSSPRRRTRCRHLDAFKGTAYGIPLRHNGEEGETQGEVEEGPRRQFIVGQAPAQGPRKFVSARQWWSGGATSPSREDATPRICTGYGRMKPWRSSTRSACATRSNATKCTTGKASRTASRDRRQALPADLIKAIERQAPENTAVGRIYMPPRTWPGSRPYMQDKYADAKAIFESRSSNNEPSSLVRFVHVNCPHLRIFSFVTFTGNPQWPEFQRNMPNTRKGHQSIIHNPNVVNRVFKAKLDELLKDLTGGKSDVRNVEGGRKGVFGPCVAYSVSIEFQNRGMPHAHILIAVAKPPRTPEDIDQYIQAEIPREPPTEDHSDIDQQQRRLRQIVLRHMIHLCDNRCLKGWVAFLKATTTAADLRRMERLTRRSEGCRKTSTKTLEGKTAVTSAALKKTRRRPKEARRRPKEARRRPKEARRRPKEAPPSRRIPPPSRRRPPPSRRRPRRPEQSRRRPEQSRRRAQPGSHRIPSDPDWRWTSKPTESRRVGANEGPLHSKPGRAHGDRRRAIDAAVGGGIARSF